MKCNDVLPDFSLITLTLLFCLGAPAAAAPPEVSGVVVDLGGRPLAGVEVAVPDGGEILATTDEEGTFTVSVPEGASLRFSKDGYLASDAVPGGDILEVRLVQEAVLRVRVVDGDGRRIEGAQVRILEPIHERVAVDEAEPEVLRRAVAREGVAVFDGLEAGMIRVEAAAEGYVSRRSGNLALRAGETHLHSLELRPRLRLSGRVLDEGGEPVADARVGAVELLPRPPWGWRRFGVKEWVEVDEEGVYHLESSPRRSVMRAVAAAAGHAPHLQRLETEGSRERRLDFRLGPPSTVIGCVLDQEGEGIAGVRIAGGRTREILSGPEGRSSHPLFDLDILTLVPGVDPDAGIRTGEDGCFLLEDLPESVFSLVAYAEGYPTARSAQFLRPGRGERLEGVVIEWRSGPCLSGFVETAEGEPVEGARVQPEGEGGRDETDARGAFRICGLDPEGAILLVSTQNHGVRTLEIEEIGATPIHIRLAPTGSLSGRVFDAVTGEPVPGFVVDLTRSYEGRRSTSLEKAFSDPEGRFLLEKIAPGDLSLSVHAEGYRPFEAGAVEVKPGEEIPLDAIHLDPGRRIRGRITSVRDGLPVVGASVSARPVYQSSSGSWSGPSLLGDGSRSTTDSEGRFELRGLPAEAVRLKARDEHHLPAERTVRLDGEERSVRVELELEVGGAVRVLVLDDEGKPAAGRDVLLRWEGEDEPPLDRSLWREATGEDGRTLFPVVPPGSYRASLHDRDEVAREVRVASGETAEVLLEERPSTGTVLHGRLLVDGEPFRPPSLASIYLEGAGEDGPWKEWAEVRGDRYESPPLPEGPCTVKGHIQNYRDAERFTGKVTLRLERELDIPPGPGRRELDLDFSVPSLALEGRVVQRDTGEPVEGAWLALEALAGGEGGGARTDGSGAFRVVVTEPGTYRIVLGRHTRERTGLRLVEEMEVEIPEQEEILVPVVQAGELTGRVIGPGGNPVPHAHVRILEGLPSSRESLPFGVRKWTRWSSGGYGTVWTDGRGRFTFQGIADGPALVYASHPDHAPVWLVDPDPDGDGDLGDIALSRGGGLELHLPPALEKNPEARLRLTRPGLPGIIELQPGRRENAYQYMAGPRTLVLPHLPEGTWTVELVGTEPARRAVVEVRQGMRATVDL